MSLEAAARIGLQLIKHRQEIGAVLQGAGQFVRGAQFDKLANSFAGKLSSKLSEKSLGGAADGMGTMQAFRQLSSFDADKNGQITREELTQGLAKLESSSNPADANLKALGNTLLKKYDQAAKLDGNHKGFSVLDLALLAGKDNRVGQLSSTDWNKLNA